MISLGTLFLRSKCTPPIRRLLIEWPRSITKKAMARGIYWLTLLILTVGISYWILLRRGGRSFKIIEALENKKTKVFISFKRQHLHPRRTLPSLDTNNSGSANGLHCLQQRVCCTAFLTCACEALVY